MKDIIYIADPKVIAIPIQECHEPLVDIKNDGVLSYGPVPECDLTKDDYTKMRRSVYDKLCKAQADLPQGWRFRLYEAYRSLKVQQMLFEIAYAGVVKRHLEFNEEQCFYETTRLASPVRHFDGSLNIPPHNTGAAVDVEMVTSEGELVDMGMAAKDWLTVHPDLCLTDNPDLSMEVKSNRALLQAVMKAHGFINYPTEWWHFSYGDRYWAYHTGAQYAIYGSVESAFTKA